jgi:2'-5' RNA ligase
LATITPRWLKLVDIQKTTSFSGEIVSVLRVERSNQLQNLHEKVCDAVNPFFTYDVTEEMTAGGQAGQSTLQWIKNYPVKSSHSNFSPHITIGYGDLPDRELPADFAVSRLAMFHLGNHCTCAKILWSAGI